MFHTSKVHVYIINRSVQPAHAVCLNRFHDYLTTMLLLGLLLALFALFFVAGRILHWDWQMVGSAAMGVMLVFTGISHFIYTEGMILMLPHIVPAKRIVVFLTGVFEIAAGIGLIIPRYRKTTALLLMIFLIIILPANFKAAYDHLSLTTATYDGPGPEYLWFRVPLQIGLILWIWYFSFRQPSKSASGSTG